MLDYSHEYHERFCGFCGSEWNDQFNENYCGFCGEWNTILYTCELCLDMFNYKNIHLLENICWKKTQASIKINQFITKYILSKRLIKYAYHLLPLYYKPTAEYILYLANNFDTKYNKKYIGYMNKDNKLKFLTFKK